MYPSSWPVHWHSLPWPPGSMLRVQFWSENSIILPSQSLQRQWIVSGTFHSWRLVKRLPNSSNSARNHNTRNYVVSQQSSWQPATHHWAENELLDWIIDKKSSPWFIPSVNEFMSKILEEDWYLTPGDTNLNESAHPHTNMHIGIGLPILEAIKK